MAPAGLCTKSDNDSGEGLFGRTLKRLGNAHVGPITSKCRSSPWEKSGIHQGFFAITLTRTNAVVVLHLLCQSTRIDRTQKASSDS